MQPWQKLLARAGHLRSLSLAHQRSSTSFPGPGLTTPEPNKSHTRMKDFYDLWLISRTFSFTGAGLWEAVKRTFERRRTEVPADVPTGLSGGFARDKDRQWRAFLGRERMAAAPENFDKVTDDLRVFLLSPLVQNGSAAYAWSPGGPWRELCASEKKNNQTAVDSSRS